jgi:hypothetical protein
MKGIRPVTIFFLLLYLSAVPLIAHQGVKHSKPATLNAQNTEPDVKKMAHTSANRAINELYLKNIKPIFQKSCFDCHSDQTFFPWYYTFPPAKWLIDRDIAEAKMHLDLSNDFPFKGHGTMAEDLEAIKEDIEEGEMPPFSYLLMHGEARLSATDKKAILAWIQESARILNAKK